MTRLDYYDILPQGMDAYLSLYGHHFSKKMCEWAIGNMRDMNGNKVSMRSKDQLDSLFLSRGIELKNNKGYDAVFSFHMCISDYLGSSVVDEMHALLYVKDTLDDKDGYDGIVFDRFIADCNAKGEPIIWSDMI